MKTYEAILTVKTHITGRDYDEAKIALQEWFSTNDNLDLELQSFYLVEDPAW